ncbi:MAG TPA: phosphosulfolactate synthase [Streptosporangiaceae bacterium]
MQSTPLSVPGRSQKPRKSGLTVVIDNGLPVQAFEDAIASAAYAIDLVKFGWGTRGGSDVNLGNVGPGDVIALETLRLGLRSDTLLHFELEHEQERRVGIGA